MVRAMEIWVLLSVAAAAAQTLRFAVQKVLASASLSPAAATWARFFFSFPVVCLVVAFYLIGTQTTFPTLSTTFWIYAFTGGLSQILATICTVALFRHRVFAVGITLKKTEVMLTALVGLVILGDTLSLPGVAAIALGFVAVLLLSEPPEGGHMINRAIMLGLASGIFFAISAVAYRGATLEIDSTDTFLRSGLTLAIVVLWQTASLGLWLRLREPGQITATLIAWRQSALVGIFSLLGSWCWFAAFSLQSAAYVFAVGQIELILSLLVGMIWFRERLTQRELFGVVLLTVSILGVVLLG